MGRILSDEDIRGIVADGAPDEIINALAEQDATEDLEAISAAMSGPSTGEVAKGRHEALTASETQLPTTAGTRDISEPQGPGEQYAGIPAAIGNLVSHPGDTLMNVGHSILDMFTSAQQLPMELLTGKKGITLADIEGALTELTAGGTPTLMDHLEQRDEMLKAEKNPRWETTKGLVMGLGQPAADLLVNPSDTIKNRPVDAVFGALTLVGLAKSTGSLMKAKEVVGVPGDTPIPKAAPDAVGQAIEVAVNKDVPEPVTQGAWMDHLNAATDPTVSVPDRLAHAKAARTAHQAETTGRPLTVEEKYGAQIIDRATEKLTGAVQEGALAPEVLSEGLRAQAALELPESVSPEPSIMTGGLAAGEATGLGRSNLLESVLQSTTQHELLNSHANIMENFVDTVGNIAKSKGGLLPKHYWLREFGTTFNDLFSRTFAYAGARQFVETSFMQERVVPWMKRYSMDQDFMDDFFKLAADDAARYISEKDRLAPTSNLKTIPETERAAIMAKPGMADAVTAYQVDIQPELERWYDPRALDKPKRGGIYLPMMEFDPAIHKNLRRYDPEFKSFTNKGERGRSHTSAASPPSKQTGKKLARAERLLTGAGEVYVADLQHLLMEGMFDRYSKAMHQDWLDSVKATSLGDEAPPTVNIGGKEVPTQTISIQETIEDTGAISYHPVRMTVPEPVAKTVKQVYDDKLAGTLHKEIPLLSDASGWLLWLRLATHGEALYHAKVVTSGVSSLPGLAKVMPTKAQAGLAHFWGGRAMVAISKAISMEGPEAVAAYRETARYGGGQTHGYKPYEPITPAHPLVKALKKVDEAIGIEGVRKRVFGYPGAEAGVRGLVTRLRAQQTLMHYDLARMDGAPITMADAAYHTITRSGPYVQALSGEMVRQMKTRLPIVNYAMDPFASAFSGRLMASAETVGAGVVSPAIKAGKSVAQLLKGNPAAARDIAVTIRGDAVTAIMSTMAVGCAIHWAFQGRMPWDDWKEGMPVDRFQVFPNKWAGDPAKDKPVYVTIDFLSPTLGPALTYTGARQAMQGIAAGRDSLSDVSASVMQGLWNSWSSRFTNHPFTKAVMLATTGMTQRVNSNFEPIRIAAPSATAGGQALENLKAAALSLSPQYEQATEGLDAFVNEEDHPIAAKMFYAMKYIGSPLASGPILKPNDLTKPRRILIARIRDEVVPWVAKHYETSEDIKAALKQLKVPPEQIGMALNEVAAYRAKLTAQPVPVQPSPNAK